MILQFKPIKTQLLLKMKSTNENTYYAGPTPIDHNNICLFSYGSNNSKNYTLKFSGYYNNSIGVAAGAAILFNHNDKEEKIIWKLDKIFGTNMTRNSAEYEALLLGIENLPKLSIGSYIKIEGSSELIMRQLAGIYEIKNHYLRKLHDLILDLLFDEEYFFGIYHVSQKKNYSVIELSKSKINKITESMKQKENVCNNLHHSQCHSKYHPQHSPRLENVYRNVYTLPPPGLGFDIPKKLISIGG